VTFVVVQPYGTETRLQFVHSILTVLKGPQPVEDVLGAWDLTTPPKNAVPTRNNDAYGNCSSHGLNRDQRSILYLSERKTRA